MAIVFPNIKGPVKRSGGVPDQASQRALRALEDWADQITDRLARLDLTAGSGTIGGVSSVTGATPISVTPTTGAVVVSLTGTYVNSLASTGVITLSGSTGAVTIGANLSAYPTGSGTLNTVAKWTPSGTQLGNSSITDTGALVTVANPLTVTGSVVVGDNAGTDSLTVKQGTASTAAASPTGTILALEQANAVTGYLSMRGTGKMGISFDALSTQEGAIEYNAVSHGFTFRTNGFVNRLTIDSNGSLFAGDTATTAIGANVSTFTLGNTSQHTADVTSLNIDLTGQTEGDFTTGGITRTTYGALIINPTSRWSSGLVNETGTLTNYGLRVVVSGGAHATNYGVYADASGNTTNYSFYGNAGLLYNAGAATFGSDVTVSGAVITGEIRTGWVHATSANQDLKLGSTFASVITEKDLYVGGSTPFSGPYGDRTLIVQGNATARRDDGGSHANRPVIDITNQATAGGFAHRADLQFNTADAGGVSRNHVIQAEGTTLYINPYTALVLQKATTITADLTVQGNTTLGDTIGDSTTIHGATTTVGVDANAGATTALLVKNPSNAASTKTDLALQDGVGDLLRITADNAGSTTAIKAVDRNTVLSFWTGAAGGAEALNINASQLATFNGSVVIGDNTGTDTLTVKQGTASTAAASVSGTILALEQANATTGYLSLRGTGQMGISFDGAATRTGAIEYNPASVANGMIFRTNGGINRFTLDGNGSAFFGDTASTGIADNVDVVTIGNTGTAQTTTGKSLLNASHTGSFNTTAGAIVANGLNVSVTSTRSAGANNLQNRAALLTASGAQQNTALQTIDGDVSLNTTSGNTTCFQNFNVNGNATLGDASADTHFLNGNLTLQNSPTAGPLKYGSLQARTLIKVQSFTASGTYTPSTGCKAARIKLVGAGGGGGGATATAGNISASAGGGSGAYVEFWIDANADLTTSANNVTIGAAGTAGSSAGGNGGAGGDTTIVISGTTFTAKGGTGGTGANNSGALKVFVGGYPQTGSGANASGTFASVAPVCLAGTSGTDGITVANGSTGVSIGRGGSNPFGIGGSGVSGGAAVQGKGAGGGGVSVINGSVAGEAGTAGFVVIEEYA